MHHHRDTHCPRPRCFGVCVFVGMLLGLSFTSAPADAQTDTFLDRAEVVSLLHPAGVTGGTVYMDIWGYTAPDGTELAILTTYESVYFVDVSRPQAPRILYQFFGPPSTHRDVRTWGPYAYSVNETSSGMQIFDLTDPMNPEWVAQYDSTFTRAHNIGIYDGYAYIAGSRMNNTNTGMRILDLSDPVRPVEVGVYTERYVHDVFARGDRAYVANINDARTTILDVSDITTPTPVSEVPSGGATHQVWLTDNSRYLLTTHENAGGHLRIWDLQDELNPTFVSYWRTTYDDGTPNDATIHNVFVRGDSAYASYYAEGLQVIDISDIENPTLAGEVDTRPTQIGGLRGVWGAYPFAANGLVYITDMVKGMYVVRLTDAEPESDFLIQPPQQVLVPDGATQVNVVFDVFNGGLFDEDFMVSVTNSQGWHMIHDALLHVPMNATEFLAVNVTVPPGVVGSMLLDVELCLTSSKTGDADCASTTPATPVVLHDLEAQWSASGAVLTWRVEAEADDAAQILVLRRPVDDPEAWDVLSILGWESTHWSDPTAFPGHSYVYALAQKRQGELQFFAEVRLQAQAPRASRLLGNAPNPFNPHTSIRFELAHPGTVTLHIHDARGRLVRTLSQHVPRAGVQSLRWDGRDQRLRELPSGVYPYAVRSGRWQARGTMTLVR